MLFPRHPKPVVSNKAVATQVAQQHQDSKAVNKHRLVIESAPSSPLQSLPPLPAQQPKK